MGSLPSPNNTFNACSKKKERQLEKQRVKEVEKK